MASCALAKREATPCATPPSTKCFLPTTCLPSEHAQKYKALLAIRSLIDPRRCIDSAQSSAILDIISCQWHQWPNMGHPNLVGGITNILACTHINDPALPVVTDSYQASVQPGNSCLEAFLERTLIHKTIPGNCNQCSTISGGLLRTNLRHCLRHHPCLRLQIAPS